MAEPATQTYANHTRLVPPFHFVALPILMLNFFYRGYLLVRAPSVETGMPVLMAVAVLIIALYARVFALTAQDRIIRLEMRARLRDALPADLRGRIEELTPKQLIALRFAGDQELADLTRRVLVDGLTEQKAIKQAIRSWKADWLRV